MWAEERLTGVLPGTMQPSKPYDQYLRRPLSVVRDTSVPITVSLARLSLRLMLATSPRSSR